MLVAKFVARVDTYAVEYVVIVEAEVARFVLSEVFTVVSVTRFVA